MADEGSDRGAGALHAAAAWPASALLNASPIGHVVLDRELRCVWLNPALATMGGLGLPEARGRPIAEVLPHLASRLTGVCREVLETEVPFLNVEIRGTSPRTPGRRRCWVINAIPLRDPAEAAMHVGATITETAEPEGLDATLRDREALFRAVFERAPVAMLVLDWRDQGLRTNAAFERVLGYTGDDLARLGVQGITHPDDFAADLEQFQRLMAGEIDHYRLAKRYLRKDGRLLWAELLVALVRDPEGQPSLIISMLEDVTDRRRAEEEKAAILSERTHLLREAQEGVRARDTFLAVAAHELRTPLTPLRMEIEALLMGARPGDGVASDPSRTPARLERVQRQVERLERLVNDLLDASRIAGGALDLTLEEVNLAETTREVVARHEAQARRGGTALEVRADQVVRGSWDRARLEQVIANLLANALKFGKGKPIEVHVTGDDRRGRLVVRDHGIGIAAEVQGGIFEKFERAASERHYPGLGLGLWISRRIVEAMGGTIAVESEPGRGATFIVELPTS